MNEEERDFIQSNKEKYKTEFLDDEELRVIFEIIESLETKLDKEKEKNEELQNYMKEYLIPKSTINLVYISKDKIKEKIEKLKKKDEENLINAEYFIKVLEDILKGE